MDVVGRVVDDAHRPLRGVTVDLADFHLGHALVFFENGIHQSQRLGRLAHVGISELVSIGALVVERIVHPNVGIHRREHRIGQREHVAADKHRGQFARRRSCRALRGRARLG